MRLALSLFAVFAVAKGAVLWGRALPWSPWTPLAYLWQDALVALVFGALVGRRRGAAPAYWLLAGYAAINVPIAAILSTPLTLPMLRATSGTLADSILLYLTAGNALKVAVTLAAAALMPTLAARLPPRAIGTAVALAAAAIVSGPAAARRADTMGLDRNVLVALVTSALPRVPANAGDETWSRPPFEQTPGDDLAHLRGVAAGRHVVLVSLESTGAQYLRLYGAAEDLTPNLDRLAASGVVFDHAYAVYPESIKGLFSVLCSTFPAFDTAADVYASAPCSSLAARLRERGYASALFHSGRFGYLGMQAIVRNRGFDLLADAADIGGNHESSFGVDEPSTVARMLEWIDRRAADRPFFLTYLPIAGHHPYETPEPGPFPTHEEVGRYRNALHYADRALGQLRAGLQRRGLDEATLWVVIGDHGEALGQHEGNYGHTFFLFEENIRVPFIVSAPGAITAAMRSRTIVSLVDTAPTLLDLIGARVPPLHQGRSALAADARMAFFFTDYSLGLLGLRDGRWKFIYELDSRRAKLFDLERDPRETHDISRAHAPRVSRYTDMLAGWAAGQKHYIGRAEAAPPPETRRRSRATGTE